MNRDTRLYKAAPLGGVPKDGPLWDVPIVRRNHQVIKVNDLALLPRRHDIQRTEEKVLQPFNRHE